MHRNKTLKTKILSLVEFSWKQKGGLISNLKGAHGSSQRNLRLKKSAYLKWKKALTFKEVFPCLAQKLGIGPGRQRWKAKAVHRVKMQYEEFLHICQ